MCSQLPQRATVLMSCVFLRLGKLLHLGPDEVRDVFTAGLSKTSPEGLKVFVNARQTVSILLEKYLDLIALGTLVGSSVLWFPLLDLSVCQEFSGAKWKSKTLSSCIPWTLNHRITGYRI